MLKRGIEESNLDMATLLKIAEMVLNLWHREIFYDNATQSQRCRRQPSKELKDQIPGQRRLATRLAYETAKRSGQTVCADL